MRKKTLASGLAISASALLLAAMAPACGGSSSQPGFTQTGPTGAGSGGGSGSGSGGGSTGPTGPTGPTFNLDASSGGPTGATADAGCATATATATPTIQPVAMEFILDGSGSMSQNNKWTAATAALSAIFSDMGTKNDPGLYAGLIVFSDKNDKTFGFGYPGPNDVPIAQVNAAQAAALQARYGGGDIQQGGTPTGTVMTGGYGVIEPFTGAGANAKKVLILITDGVPTDNCAPSGGSYPSNQCVMQAATELAKASPAGPVETFAIGVGIFPSTDLTNFDPSFLGNLAVAGGSAPPGCDPNNNTSLTNLCYFEVDPSGSSAATQAAFEAAINAIRGKVVSISCTFKLNLSDAGAIDPGKVNVVVNGTTVPPDPVNGWTYDNPTNPTSVTLHGTSCASVTGLDSGTASVSIELGCLTIPPPKPQ